MGASSRVRRKATVTISPYAPVTYNDPTLTTQMLPTLQWAASGKVAEAPLIMGSEDFAFYVEKIPGLFEVRGVESLGEPVVNLR